ncbi:hypothetical protein HPB48_009817 [Haemaphysalis longicornis]|uniref:Uncharacterized protein n=1 Tax=Haemaphysalis longicornis TaxID=44386 RepID=A0A9J6G1D6_HAELO|nr:hypothetical protein HPB48_009817 [Haemaphysalis longicornis]
MMQFPGVARERDHIQAGHMQKGSISTLLQRLVNGTKNPPYLPRETRSGRGKHGRTAGRGENLITFPPTNDFVFNVTVPADASTVFAIDAVSDVIGLPNVYMVQSLQGAKFHCKVYMSAAMQQLYRLSGLSICGKTIAVEALAPRLTRVACPSLPVYVADEHLLRALAPYGKVVGIERFNTIDRPSAREWPSRRSN